MALPEGPRMPPVVQIARWLFKPTQFFKWLADRYGEIFTIVLPGLGPIVVTSNPEAIREVFLSPTDALHAGEANVVLRPLLGERSLLVLDGEEHARERKMMLPPFHGERMRAYGATMLELARTEVAKWREGDAFPVHGSMQEITLRVIVRTIFGVEDGARMEALCALLNETTNAASSPLLLFPPLQRDLGAWSPWGRVVRGQQRVRDVIDGEIARRRNAKEGARPYEQRDDVLSLLLDARDEGGQPMDDLSLFHQLVTLLVAGHETTATSLAWALRWLLEDRALVATLRSEIRATAEGGVLRADKLAKLELLDAVVRETLRLQPVVPIVARVAKKPIKLLGYSLPTGSRIAASIWLAHRRPAAWPDPERFDPYRFVGKKPSPFEWLPFGGGARRCIGAEFAMYEMKMVLAAILAEHDLELAPGPRSKIRRRAVTFAPHDGVRVVLRGRALLAGSAGAPEARTAP